MEIIRQEGPIHSEEIGRRVAAACGKQKAGGRIQECVKESFGLVGKDGIFQFADGFWLTEDQRKDIPLRDRSEMDQTTRKAEYLSLFEISAAGKYIGKESGTVDKDALIQAVARLLGYQRIGDDLKKRLEVGIYYTY